MADVAIRLQPRAKREEVVGERAGAIVIRVTAPPVDGKANAALCAFIAKAAGVPSVARRGGPRADLARQGRAGGGRDAPEALRAALLR